MGREWRAGDVAMVTAANRREEYRAFFDGQVWRESRHNLFCVVEPTTHRPLVVIDPEDREQVKALMRALWRADEGLFGKRSVSDWVPLLAGALRSLVAPTPPCGASLTLGKDGALYRCGEDEGHKGPHVDGTCTWTAQS